MNGYIVYFTGEFGRYASFHLICIQQLNTHTQKYDKRRKKKEMVDMN